MNVDRDGEFGPNREFRAAAPGSRRGPGAWVLLGRLWGLACIGCLEPGPGLVHGSVDAVEGFPSFLGGRTKPWL